MIAKSPNSNKNVARIGIIVTGWAQPIEGKQLAARKRQIERRLDKSKLTGLRAERAELYRLRSTSRINDDTLRSLVREIDLIEASIRAAARAPDPPTVTGSVGKINLEVKLPGDGGAPHTGGWRVVFGSRGFPEEGET
jgi:hypothetical protein